MVFTTNELVFSWLKRGLTKPSRVMMMP